MAPSPTGISPTGPTLAQVLMQRMFARPPRLLVDGDLIEALRRADQAEAAAAPAELAPAPVPVDPTREALKGRRVDVRA